MNGSAAESIEILGDRGILPVTHCMFHIQRITELSFTHLQDDLLTTQRKTLVKFGQTQVDCTENTLPVGFINPIGTSQTDLGEFTVGQQVENLCLSVINTSHYVGCQTIIIIFFNVSFPHSTFC